MKGGNSTKYVVKGMARASIDVPSILLGVFFLDALGLQLQQDAMTKTKHAVIRTAYRQTDTNRTTYTRQLTQIGQLTRDRTTYTRQKEDKN
jgi:hypothetical protein